MDALSSGVLTGLPPPQWRLYMGEQGIGASY